jgi:nitroimidazol reductase NimA-like FMN-containing flavoprotein (pyridoxamine 5'-phosphate oxidase superfamily)
MLADTAPAAPESARRTPPRVQPSRRSAPIASLRKLPIASGRHQFHLREGHQMPPSSPEFRDLTTDECHALLARHNVGRIAFTRHDRVDIEPISYVSDGEWIFGRTSVGAKLATLLHHPWCAFETDEVRDIFDWDSVVVKGTFYILDPEEGSPDTYRRAQKLVQKLVPGTFTARDPTPHRDILFGIFIHEISGRSARR